MSIKIDPQTLLADVVAFSGVFPQVVAAYNAYKVIWSVANPGKTEQDYLDHLTSQASAAISAADAVLQADGYVQDASGHWSKPAPPAAA